MLRRGAAGRGAVVVGWVVVEDRAPLNATQTAQDTAQHGGKGFGVGEVHAQHRASLLAQRTEFRSARQVFSVPKYWTPHDAAQLTARLSGENVDSLAVTLGVHRSVAAELLNGGRRWTDGWFARLCGRAA